MASGLAAAACKAAPELAAAALATALAAAVFSAALFSTALPAHAQAPADAGSSSAAPNSAGSNSAASEPANPAPPGGLPEGLKTLSPQQRLPENLQGWMRERNRLHSAFAERSAPAPERNAAPDSEVHEENAQRKASVEEYKRRLRSFDEDGVTVLSNRRPAPPIVRLAARAVEQAAPPAAAPPEPSEAAPETERVTETRSLRTNQLQAKHPVSEPELGWSVWAAALAALGLGVVWLRRRRAAG
jgi:MYXO-CTERM domain-containing protein